MLASDDLYSKLDLNLNLYDIQCKLWLHEDPKQKVTLPLLPWFKYTCLLLLYARDSEELRDVLS